MVELIWTSSFQAGV